MKNDILKLIFDCHDKYMAKEPLTHELSEFYSVLSNEICEKFHKPDVIKSVCEHELIKIKNRTVEICKKCGKPWILG